MSTSQAVATLEQLEFDVTGEAARDVVVRNEATYAAAAESLQGIKALMARIHESCDPVCASTHAAWKTAVKQRDDLLAPLLDAERGRKRAMAVYYDEQQRQARIREAELVRLAQKAEEDARLAEASALEQAGETQAAEQVLNAPTPTPAVSVAPAVPAVKGTSAREVWRAELTDLKALCAAVAAGTVPLQALEANLKFLNGQARLLKTDLGYPGVRAVRETTIASRSA